jgi:nitrite reductase/ring-hydroxylating ferredoxin subunit
MPVTLERMYENALDWEHLPWLHSSSFMRIDLIKAGRWGWHANAQLAATDASLLPDRSLWIAALKRSARYQPWRLLKFSASLVKQLVVSAGSAVELQLLLDTDKRRWITTTLSGIGKGGEIWTEVIEHGPQDIEVVVDFYIPNIPQPIAAPLGEYYKNLYRRLYDEDQEMMEFRHSALNIQIVDADQQSLLLGPLEELRPQLPLSFTLSKRQWSLRENGGELIVHPTYCPHRLGPIEGAELSEQGEISCPWHGYRFDLTTGENTSGQRCRLPKPPRLEVTDEGILVSASS